MALHYFIDGYNVIQSNERLRQGSLRAQRERLLKFIEEKRPQGSERNQVTVVFDSREGSVGPGWAGNTKVIFSDGKDADTVIKEKIDGLKTPADAVVVTNDKDIQRWVRGAKAKVLSCGEFLKSAAGAARQAPSPGKPTADEAQDINEEFKKLWKLK